MSCGFVVLMGVRYMGYLQSDVSIKRFWTVSGKTHNVYCCVAFFQMEWLLLYIDVRQHFVWNRISALYDL